MQLQAVAKNDGWLDPGPFEMNIELDQRQTFLIHQAAQFVGLSAKTQKEYSCVISY